MRCVVGVAIGWIALIILAIGMTAWGLCRMERWQTQRLTKNERQRVADAIETLQREVQR